MCNCSGPSQIALSRDIACRLRRQYDDVESILQAAAITATTTTISSNYRQHQHLHRYEWVHKGFAALSSWLFGRLAGWLAGWLVGRLTKWRALATHKLVANNATVPYDHRQRDHSNAENCRQLKKSSSKVYTQKCTHTRSRLWTSRMRRTWEVK